MTRKGSRFPLLLAAAGVGALGLTNCSVTEDPPETKETTYSSAAKARESDAIPALLPDDATAITIEVHLRESGAALRFDSEVGIEAEYCEE